MIPTIGAESGGPAARSLRSTPAQKTDPVWVSTMARTSAASARSSASCTSVVSCFDSALRFAGESNVIVATAPVTLNCTRASSLPRVMQDHLSVDEHCSIGIRARWGGGPIHHKVDRISRDLIDHWLWSLPLPSRTSILAWFSVAFWLDF